MGARLKILVTGSAGFIAGYLVEELLEHGHTVVGIDNYSKYGPVKKSYDDHPKYRFIQGDAKDVSLLKQLIDECDQVVASAAMVGGIGYFHEFAYDLLAENERIIAATFDAAIWAFKNRNLKKINVISSSMVYESCDVFPSREGDERRAPPPASTYGFQKLACEYFCQGAWEQYRLPYTILRPFNCVGTGEKRAIQASELASGNIKLALSHVIPDLVQKILAGQQPLHLLGSGGQIRHYTAAKDVARGIRMAVESDKSINQDFNLSTRESKTVAEVAEMLWRKLRPEQEFNFVTDSPFQHDVQKRVPDVKKAQALLGFEALTPLDQILEEVIAWIKQQA